MSSRNCCWLELFQELDKRSILWKATSCPWSAAQGVRSPLKAIPAQGQPGLLQCPEHLPGFRAGLVPQPGEAGCCWNSHIHSFWLDCRALPQTALETPVQTPPAIKGDFVPAFPLDQHAASPPGPHSGLCGLVVSFCWEFKAFTLLSTANSGANSAAPTPRFHSKNHNFHFPLFKP